MNGHTEGSARYPAGFTSDGTLWLWWVAWSSVGGTLVLPLALRAYDAAYELVHGTSSVGSDLFPVVPLLLCLCGAVIALGHWLGLRRRVAMPGWLVVLWLGSGLPLGFAGSAFFFADVLDPTAQLLPGGLVASVFGCVAATVQALVLSGRVWWAYVWIPLGALGSGIGWPVGVYLGTRLVGWVDGAVVGYTGDGFVTGLLLVMIMHVRKAEASSSGRAQPPA